MKNRKTQYYESFAQDCLKTRNQGYRVPENYEWIKRSVFYGFLEKIVFVTAKLYARIYLSLGLGVKVRDMTGGEESGRAEPPSAGEYCGKKGCFLYGNHTLPQGDVFIPVKCRPHHRIYTVVSAANLGIPVLGRLLPMLGAIPVPDSLHQMAAFRDAVCERVAEGGCVVIYPEAHVWPYYTGIRPFERGTFSYPAETGASCYCSTVTYQKHRWRRRPAVTVWLDGPFYPDMSLKKKQRQRQLEEEIHACMCRRSKESSYEYIRYEEIKK